MNHEWSGVPGLYCTICFNESPLEDALVCPECVWSGGEYGLDVHEPCEKHKQWENVLLTGCPPDPEQVKLFKDRWMTE